MGLSDVDNVDNVEPHAGTSRIGSRKKPFHDLCSKSSAPLDTTRRTLRLGDHCCGDSKGPMTITGCSVASSKRSSAGNSSTNFHAARSAARAHTSGRARFCAGHTESLGTRVSRGGLRIVPVRFGKTLLARRFDRRHGRRHDDALHGPFGASATRAFELLDCAHFPRAAPAPV
jgi:hypothetical protein